MKQLMELVGGLVLLVGGLGTFGLQGLQSTQAVQSMAVGQAKKVVETEKVETEKAVQVREVETKEKEEYYDYKEDVEVEMWEKMKAHYKDYAGGVGDEQSN
jgi:5'-3' exonuclease